MIPPNTEHHHAPADSAGQIKPWIRSILVPLDYSDASWAALNHAIPVARLMGAKITLLNVCEAQLCATEFAHLPEEEASMRIASTEKLRALAHTRIPAELLKDIVIRRGVAFEEIINAAAVLEVDLIVINTRGNIGLKHAFLGSTTEHVVRHAPCPVLVIRERKCNTA
jgi:nucleotide-binding universal stress UspA family protein